MAKFFPVSLTPPFREVWPAPVEFSLSSFGAAGEASVESKFNCGRGEEANMRSTIIKLSPALIRAKLR
jgi:hypothetical protein